MSTAGPMVIELNDLALRAGSDAGLLAASPGFALLQGKEVLLGAQAEARHRLYPTSSYDKFWHELNMEPLPVRSRIRHHADLAYSHLLAIAGEAEIDGEVIFAAPGHFSREQLGLLLGIAGQCPFQVAGMIDSALAAAGDAETGDELVYIALHLHQILLTRLRRSGGELAVDKVVQAPQIGRQQLLDALLRIANDAFIRQCRFNPQHEAASEQQLYSLLADWLDSAGPEQERAREGARESLPMELDAGTMTHRAKLPQDQILSALGKLWRSLLASLAPLLESPATGILLDHRLAHLPGVRAALGEAGPLRITRPGTIIENCLRHGDQITAGEGVRRIRSLALNEARETTGHEDTPAIPTHVLFRNRALPVDDLSLVSQANGSAGAALALDVPGPAATLGRIVLRQSRVLLDCGDNEFRINDAPVTGSQPLRLGDRVRFPQAADELLLIEVGDGRRT